MSPGQSASRNCTYCEGIGCSECGETGKRYGVIITTDDGLNISAHGSGDMTQEIQDALVEVARAAFKRMDETP